MLCSMKALFWARSIIVPFSSEPPCSFKIRLATCFPFSPNLSQTTPRQRGKRGKTDDQCRTLWGLGQNICEYNGDPFVHVYASGILEFHPSWLKSRIRHELSCMIGVWGFRWEIYAPCTPEDLISMGHLFKPVLSLNDHWSRIQILDFVLSRWHTSQEMLLFLSMRFMYSRNWAWQPSTWHHTVIFNHHSTSSFINSFTLVLTKIPSTQIAKSSLSRKLSSTYVQDHPRFRRRCVHWNS